jgi:hypothetical protein
MLPGATVAPGTTAPGELGAGPAPAGVPDAGLGEFGMPAGPAAGAGGVAVGIDAGGGVVVVLPGVKLPGAPPGGR